MNNIEIYDDNVWENIDSEDLWVYDKVILSKMLGYKCGLRGIDVPKSGKYIVRPISNLLGMGIGAKIININKSTENKVKDGFFWCEIFKGRHFSVDFYKKKQILCVEGFRKNEKNLKRWCLWKKIKKEIKFPSILNKLKGNYDWINVEMIENKIIEIQLRANPDFYGHNSDFVIPVWKGMSKKPPKNCKFISDKDDSRIGFFIQKED